MAIDLNLIDKLLADYKKPEDIPRVPKPGSKAISVGAASAANASGSLQTALSKVTRRIRFVRARSLSRRVTSDRVLTFTWTVSLGELGV
jgi:hypothetical protein